MENSEDIKDATREQWLSGNGNARPTAPNGSKNIVSGSPNTSVMTNTVKPPSLADFIEILGILSDVQSRLKLPAASTRLENPKWVVVAIPTYGHKVDRVKNSKGKWVYTVDGNPIRPLEESVMTPGHDTEKK